MHQHLKGRDIRNRHWSIHDLSKQIITLRKTNIPSYTLCIRGSSMGIVPVRIDDDQLKRIDLLVKRGVYKTRNQAIREMLKTRLLEELSEDEDVEDIVRVLIETKKKGHEPLVLQFEKSAVETVAEGRS